MGKPQNPTTVILKNKFYPTPNKNLYVKKNNYDNYMSLLENVEHIGLGCCRTFNLDSNKCIDINRYYKTEIDYINLYDKKEKYSYNNALSIIRNVIHSNLQKIYEKYNDLTVIASIGIDSLVILDYFDNKKNVDVISFTSDFCPGINDSKDFKKLHDTLSLPCTVIDYSKETFFSACINNLLQWNFPIYEIGLGLEVFLLNNYVTKDIIVSGGMADKILWHDSVSSIIWCIHKEKLTSVSDIHSFMKDRYSYQPLFIPKNIYKLCKSTSYEECLISNFYFRRASITGFMSQTVNKLIISPYSDIRLMSLLPQCDLETQKKAILDVQLQKDMISKKLLSHLPSRCIGTIENIKDISYADKKIITKIYKKLYESNIELPINHQNRIANILNKDVVTLFEINEQMLVGAYIYNWIK